MNAAERDQLQQFLSALRQTRAEAKDPVADALIREAVANQADAPYCLVQRAMGLALSLQAAQARIEQLEAQCAQLQASRPSPKHVAKILEDVLLKFIERHNRAIWALILAIALAVVYGVNRG